MAKGKGQMEKKKANFRTTLLGMIFFHRHNERVFPFAICLLPFAF